MKLRVKRVTNAPSPPPQGDIVSCAGTYIHVWSINGNPVVSVNTFTGRSQQIVCCCMSEMNEWDTQNVIVTGHSDGVVRVSDFTHVHVHTQKTCLRPCPGWRLHDFA